MPHIARADKIGNEVHLFDAEGRVVGHGPTLLDAVADMYRRFPPDTTPAARFAPCAGIHPSGKSRWRAMLGRKYLGTFATIEEALSAQAKARKGRQSA